MRDCKHFYKSVPHPTLKAAYWAICEKCDEPKYPNSDCGCEQNCEYNCNYEWCPRRKITKENTDREFLEGL